MVYNNIISTPTFTSEGTTEPVTLAEAKLFLRLTTNAVDAQISALISSSRVIIEKYLNRSLITRTVEVEVAHDGRFPLELPYGPVTQTATDVFSITSVFYRAGYRQTWTDVTAELNDLFEFNGLDNCSLMGNVGQYRIKYTCSALSGEIFKTAIKQQVTFLYENRGDEQLFQVGSARQPGANVCDIVKHTLAGQSRVTWFG